MANIKKLAIHLYKKNSFELLIEQLKSIPFLLLLLALLAGQAATAQEAAFERPCSLPMAHGPQNTRGSSKVPPESRNNMKHWQRFMSNPLTPYLHLAAGAASPGTQKSRYIRPLRIPAGTMKHQKNAGSSYSKHCLAYRVPPGYLPPAAGDRDHSGRAARKGYAAAKNSASKHALSKHALSQPALCHQATARNQTCRRHSVSAHNYATVIKTYPSYTFAGRVAAIPSRASTDTAPQQNSDFL